MYKVNEQGNPEPPQPTSNFAPTADGTAGEPYKADVGVELRFNGSRSYDRDGTIVSWLWSLGDGTTDNGVIITHTYTTAGTYEVILTVTDNGGKRDSYQTFAQIGPNHPPLKPTLTGPTEGKKNIAYVFNAVTTDPDHDDLRYIIRWGDNSQNNSPYVKSGNTVQTMHQWATWGFYAVQVSAQDINNLTSEIYEAVIAIDVRYVGKLGYLINTDSTGSYDAFYSNSTKKQSNVQQQNGIYSIDANNDGSFDYQYDPSKNTIQPIQGPLGSIYPILIVGVIIAILLLLLLWLLARRKKNKPNQ
jgi:PKD repeat protein